MLNFKLFQHSNYLLSDSEVVLTIAVKIEIISSISEK